MLKWLLIAVGLIAAAAPFVYQPDTPTHYKVADFVMFGDCVDGSCDLAPAIEAAMSACEANPPRAQGSVGCDIELPPGDHTLSRTPVLCRGHTIYGQGGRGDGLRTMLRTDPGISCFRVAGHGECAVPGSAGAVTGSGFQLRDFGCVGDVTSSTSAVSGLVIEANGEVRNVLVRYYVRGVYVSANVSRTPATNANLFRLIDVHSWNNEHSALFIQGSDTNAHYIESFSAIHNCREYEKWQAELGDCSAIQDFSFLGGTQVASHVAATRGNPGYHIGLSPNQQSVLINPYLEGGSPAGHLAANSSVLGQITNGQPISNNVNGGLELNGRRVNRMQFDNWSDNTNRVELRLGDWGIGGVALVSYARSLGGTTPLYWRAQKAKNNEPAQWGFGIAPTRLSLGVEMEGSPPGALRLY